MRTPTDIPLLRNLGDLKGKRVFLAVDLNLPVRDGRVVDDYRLLRSRPTFDFLKKNGARVLLVSHRSEEDGSLFPVHAHLMRTEPLAFARDLPEARSALAAATEGGFVLLENIRKIGGEREKKNDPSFARELSALADVYVNEAFSASHRAYASIVGVPRFLPSAAGLLFAEEVANLSKAFSPSRPALVILGGAKFETKMPLIRKFLEIADTVYVCGALANDFYAARGYHTGVSQTSASRVGSELHLHPRISVPSDVVVRTASGERKEKEADTVREGEKIVDIGSGSLSDLKARVGKARFVLWNGPLGEYEAGFSQGTAALAQCLAESAAETIVGGGDSLAVVSALGLMERFSFVSTGGGAMLEFLADGTLPGIEALLSFPLRSP